MRNQILISSALPLPPPFLENLKFELRVKTKNAFSEVIPSILFEFLKFNKEQRRVTNFISTSPNFV